MNERRSVKPPLGRRFLGVPWLWAVAHSAIAFSIYYSLGVVAESGLALTPVIFGVAGLVYVVTTMTYVEGGAMFRERGGSNTLARHAFNELISFIAGWAILIDYVIVIALAAISVPHYLAPISTDLSSGTGEIAIGVGVVALVCGVNIVGFTGHRRQGWLVALTAADVFLQFALIVIGIAVVWDPSALTSELHLFGTPSVGDIALALVISMVALAGIEAASDLAPDLLWRSEDLKHVLRAGSIVVPFVYIGMAVVALMAVPVVAGPNGPETALSSTYVDAPVLGVTAAFHPDWLADITKWAVVAIAPSRPALRGQRHDARPLQARLRARDEPPDPQLARQARQAAIDSPRGDPDRRAVRGRPRAAGVTSTCWRESSPSAPCWRSRSLTSR